VWYPNIPLAILSVPHCLFQNAANSFSLDCDEEEENTPKKTCQTYTSINPEFFLNLISAESHKIMRKPRTVEE